MPTKQLEFTHTATCTDKGFKSIVELDKVQGDVLVQFPKRVEDFNFFTIKNAELFKKRTMPKLLSKISSTRAVMDLKEKISEHKKAGREGLLRVECMNISFTYNGLKTLGLNPDELPSSDKKVFKEGQLKDASNLGDPVKDGLPEEWTPQFKDLHDQIHGVLIVACDSNETIKESRGHLDTVLGEHAKVIHTVHGDTRSAEENLKDHEHFGWKDGISNPWLQGVFCQCRKINGQWPIQPGTILVGYSNDVDNGHWAKNGSYMVFRQLEQLVPEFHQWTRDNAIRLDIPGASPEDLLEKGAALRAAQLVGRWPQGTPLQSSPFEDQDKYAKNPKEINNFVYKLDSQTRCPFSAHVRKMNPRLTVKEAKGIDFGKNSIVRAGIAYGKELNDSERRANKTELPRGLAFVSYQADIVAGFQFQQHRWANKPNFPPTGLTKDKNHVEFGISGLDPLIGQGPDPQARITTDNAKQELSLARFVVPRGGAYFFMPSMKVLRDLSI